MNSVADRYDLAVIGAGINGAGIARDAALRGLKVVLLDKGDLCSGTSWISSRLIHGGLRYLEYGEIPLVYESLHERRNLRVIAPHLVKALRISIPVYRGAKRGPWLIRLGMLAYDILSWGKRLPRHEMLGRDGIIDEEPGLNTVGLRAAARYYDAQISYAERLVLENLLAAQAAGADIRLYNTVQELRAGTVNTVHCADTLNGQATTMQADIVVNAAGPWVDSVLACAGADDSALIGGTKGSHIVVSPFNGAPNDALYVEAASDGRPFFIIPWNKQYLIGTTDIRYDGNLDAIRASEAEVEYLLAETNRVLPEANLRKTDINFAYAGVRPLPRRNKGPESAITRRHIIKANRDIGNGVLSIIGGKLTTFRNLAEQTVDRVGRKLHRKLPACRTADTLLPGAHGIERAREQLAGIDAVSETGIERLIDIYGGRAQRLLALAGEEQTLQRTLDDAGTVLAAEVALAVREEFARTLIDIVFRRLLLGLRADQGRSCYPQLAELAAAELDWDDARQQAETDALLAYSDSLRV